MLRFIAALALVASPALAQANCAPRPDVVAGLLRNYGETAQAEGMTPQGIVEVYAAQSGSWTITITGPDGVTCLLASGHDFHAIPQGVTG